MREVKNQLSFFALTTISHNLGRLSAQNKKHNTKFYTLYFYQIVLRIIFISFLFSSSKTKEKLILISWVGLQSWLSLPRFLLVERNPDTILNKKILL